MKAQNQSNAIETNDLNFSCHSHANTKERINRNSFYHNSKSIDNMLRFLIFHALRIGSSSVGSHQFKAPN